MTDTAFSEAAVTKPERGYTRRTCSQMWRNEVETHLAKQSRSDTSLRRSDCRETVAGASVSACRQTSPSVTKYKRKDNEVSFLFIRSE